MKLFKKKPKKMVTKYRVIVTTDNIRYHIESIPTKQKAIILVENILKSRKIWVRFGSFYFLRKNVQSMQLDSYAEEVKK